MYADAKGSTWRLRILAPALTAVVVLSACAGARMPASETGAQPIGATGSELIGVYTLVSANGRAVPTDVDHDNVTMRVVSGSLTFGPGGTCRSLMRFVPPGGQAMDREVAARWTRAGDTLTLQWDGAGTTTAVVDGDTVTMDNVGLILVYRRGG
jgi:hypothetical protein